MPPRRPVRFLGFTLVELLVVIAVVGILAGLLLPVLAGAKSKARSVECLTNQRQLILACLLHAADHDDAFPRNLGATDTRATVAAGKFLNWANNVMSWELDADNTNSLWLRKGGLGLYLGQNMRSFQCPTDSALSKIQRSAGWTKRVRSVSMNAMVGDAGQFTSSGSNTNNPHYTQFFKLSHVPEPSRIFVFIEEHPDSINDGYFLNRAYSGEWHDLPASYHDGAANLAFADGHTERHQWSSSHTRPPAEPDAAHLPRAIPPNDRADFQWLIQHTSVKHHSP